MAEQPSLKRVLNLPLLVLYGLGTTIGAGIYALAGKVAGNAGLHAPFAFLLSAALVAFSAFSFAELSSRLPHSAGEAVYVQEGFGRRWLALLVGLLLVLAGTVSCAALARGFAGYFQGFVALPAWLGVLVLVTLVIFALVNLALWRLKGRVPVVPGTVSFPRWISLCGCVVCGAVLVLESLRLIL